jgi:hypothetical protein
MICRPRALAVATLILLSLAACGKAGRPPQPPDSVYPRIYPDPSAGPTAIQQKDGRALPPEWDQQDLNARFTPGGSYIDPSTKVAPGAQILPASNLPNTTRSPGTDPFGLGIGSSSQSPLPPLQPSPSSDEEDQQR